MDTLRNIAAAARNARQRTGNASIGTRVRAGLFDVVNVTYRGAVSKVDILSSNLTAKQTINHLMNVLTG